uniref:Uncharacterized protein n=1 Tax=Plectus sambesii TaxID=2011161 RepID=A0A914VCP7_9BILA
MTERIANAGSRRQKKSPLFRSVVMLDATAAYDRTTRLRRLVGRARDYSFVGGRRVRALPANPARRRSETIDRCESAVNGCGCESRTRRVPARRSARHSLVAAIVDVRFLRSAAVTARRYPRCRRRRLGRGRGTAGQPTLSGRLNHGFQGAMHGSDAALGRLLWFDCLAMPRVVDDQRAVFARDEFLVSLSRLTEVRYSGYIHARELGERKAKFIEDCQAGRIPVTFPALGLNFELHAPRPLSTAATAAQPTSSSNDGEFVRFEEGSPEVHICSRLILNGVCVRWKGTINRENLAGQGQLEYDEQHAQEEELRLRAEVLALGDRFRILQEQLAVATHAEVSLVVSIEPTDRMARSNEIGLIGARGVRLFDARWSSATLQTSGRPLSLSRTQ